MERISIQSYQVSISSAIPRSDLTDQSPTRKLLLKGTADGGSAPTRIWIGFEGHNQSMIDGRFVGLAFPPRNGTRRLDVTMHSSAFEGVYDILRNESPTFFVFDVRDQTNNPTSSTKLITVAQLGTFDEIPGEGPADSDAPEE